MPLPVPARDEALIKENRPLAKSLSAIPPSLFNILFKDNEALRTYI